MYRRKSNCRTLFAAACFVSGMSHSSQGLANETRAQDAYKAAATWVQSPLLETLPPLTPNQIEELESRDHPPGRIVVPVDPRTRAEEIVPTGSPSEAGFADPRAPGDFVFFRNTALNDTATNDSTSQRSNEPSVGVNGRVAFYSGNFYASVSADGGETWSYVNPSDNFPSDGVPDPVNNGFCCDQIVYYERTRGTMFWLLQYSADSNTNTQRLAVASSQQDVANNAWFLYDWSPASFGFSASGFWLDFPDLSTSDNYLYLTSNVFQIGSGSTSTAVIARFPLDELSQGQGFTYNYLVTGRPGLRCTHGATSTMYFGAHNSNTSIRIYRWPESSGTVSWDDVSHSAYNTGTMTAPGPDGLDWAGFADSRILAAFRAGGELGFMWNSAQGGSFPFPHVRVVTFLESDRSLDGEGQIWNSNHAWLYPSVHTDDRGHLGGTIAWGGGDWYPNASAWIADDFNGVTIAPLENLTFAVGDSGPSVNRWGDYLTARRHVPYGNTWAGTAWVNIGGSAPGNAEPHFVWFGRDRDRPPTTNTIHVDRTNISGWEDGTIGHPYDTVTEGHFATLPGDTVVIQAGVYPEQVTLDRACTLLTTGGATRIGG